MEDFNERLGFQKIVVDEDMLRGREMQETIVAKMLKHKYQSMELETMQEVLVAEFKYNEELYNENERMKEAIKKFIELEGEYIRYEGPAIDILKEALNGK